MASLIYNRALELFARGNIDFDSDTFKAMLVSASYTPNKDTHDYRNDVTNEISGTGYTAGGATVTCTVNLDALRSSQVTTTSTGVLASITAASFYEELK